MIPVTIAVLMADITTPLTKAPTVAAVVVREHTQLMMTQDQFVVKLTDYTMVHLLLYSW